MIKFFYLLSKSLFYVVDQRQRSLRWHYQRLGVAAHLRATSGTLVFLVFRDAHAHSHFSLYAPVFARQHPRVAITKAYGTEVALVAIVAQTLKHAQWQLNASYVVVGIDEVHAKEMSAIGRTQPIACLRLHRNMAQLLVVGESEGIVANRQFSSPPLPYLGLKSKIGCGSCPIQGVGLQHRMLSVCTYRKQKKHGKAKHIKSKIHKLFDHINE